MQKEFFSEKHKVLLNIATWTKYLAWVILVVYALSTWARYMQIRATYMMQTAQPFDLRHLFSSDPFYGFSFVVSIFSVFVFGVIWYFVLKGISLGLYMIVETDINYRENKSQEADYE